MQAIRLPKPEVAVAMRGKGAVATRSILPGSPSKYVYVLVDNTPKVLELPEILDLWEYNDGCDISWFPQALRNEKCTNQRENITALHYVVIDLDFSLAEKRYGLSVLLKEIRRLQLPNPTMVVLTGGGFHVYWSIGQLYIGSRKGKSQQEDYKWHEYWCDQYEKATNALCLLLSSFGADRQATPVTHLFRLPGSFTPKHEVQTGIVHRDDEAETTLSDLGDAVGRLLKRTKAATAGSSTSSERQYTRVAKRRTLDTPAIQWLLNHKIPEGSRYNATFPVIQACLFSGLSEDETRSFVYRLNSEQCVPPRPENQIDAQIKSCVRRHGEGKPYGISPDWLMTVQSVDGSTMGQATARTVFAGLPGGTEFPERVRKHRKRNGKTTQALDHCIALIHSGEISGEQTDKEVANRIGISTTAFKNSVKPELKSQGLCTTNLNQVPRATTYACPTRPAPSTTYETEQTKGDPSAVEGSRLVDEGGVTDGVLGALAGLLRRHSRYYEPRRPI